MAENKKYIEDLISALTCLPGVGKKTAQRMTYHLLQRGKDDALNLSHVLEDVVTNIKNCKTCRNLCHSEECDLCSDPGRIKNMLCVVESPADVFNLENSTNYKGKYFVLLGRLSPLDGIGPKEIGIDNLDKILSSGETQELILALNYTVESDVTAHVIGEIANKNSIKVTRLAQGVPVGGELEYLDQHTLSKAFDKRTAY